MRGFEGSHVKAHLIGAIFMFGSHRAGIAGEAALHGAALAFGMKMVDATRHIIAALGEGAHRAGGQAWFVCAGFARTFPGS